MSCESLRAELEGEISKWTRKLERELTSVRGEEKTVENIRAYLEDSKHFHSKGELVKSFECLIWGWALLQLGREVGLIYDQGEK